VLPGAWSLYWLRRKVTHATTRTDAGPADAHRPADVGALRDCRSGHAALASRVTPRLGGCTGSFIAELDDEVERTGSVEPQHRLEVRLVVLPFTNLSDDPAQEYFSDGLTEELIAQLGATCRGRIGVIARCSSNAFKGTSMRAREIGETLRAGYLLEGSVRSVGDSLRITARLIRVGERNAIVVRVVRAQSVEVSEHNVGPVIDTDGCRVTCRPKPRARAHTECRCASCQSNFRCCGI
jgi:TolB-like protein